jgi:putative sterol carrier protein
VRRGPSTLALRGEQVFRAAVHRSSDRGLERTIGSTPGLRVLFTGMTRRFVPKKAAGFAGEVQYDLRLQDGRVRSWTVAIDGERARARPGAAAAPRVTLRLALADFIRIAARDLDPVRAALAGKLEIRGDTVIAMRLGEMFGEPSRF